MPLPDAMWVKWRDQIVASLHRNLPQWREREIDADGAANFPAMAATLSQLLFNVADKRPPSQCSSFRWPTAGMRCR